MRKFLNTIAVFSILMMFLFVGASPLMAQEGGFELPDIDTSQPGSENETPGEDNDTPTSPGSSEQIPNQAFLTGLAAGAAVGLIVGGTVIWFTKKN